MDKINACMVSFFMDNMDMKTVGLQKSVVDKFNVNKYPHYHIKTDMKHGASIDHFWAMNGIVTDSLKGRGIEKRFDHDIVLIMDIDCIPLSEKAIDLYVSIANNGKLVGNAQRSGHLQNNKHVFSAPSASALSAETYLTIGKPSALETSRSDVLEEYTWAAEKVGVLVEKFMPLRYDSPPIRMTWEPKDLPPYWSLADGMPNYGIGTTYGDEKHGDLFWHCFQMHADPKLQQERFWAKCESILKV